MGEVVNARTERTWSLRQLVRVGVIFTFSMMGCGRSHDGKAPLSPGMEVRQWVGQMASPEIDCGSDIAVDASGDVYCAGYTRGNMEGCQGKGYFDVFLAKYDCMGKKLWAVQPGTSGNDAANAVAVDSFGNAYLAGYTEGSFEGNKSNGGKDIFVARYDASGTKMWAVQMGTDKDEEAKAIAVDSMGNAYVTGYTEGALDGKKNSGNRDIFITKFDAKGNKKWTKLVGTAEWDIGYDIALDKWNNLYVTGSTMGGIDGSTNEGYYDIVLLKMSSDGHREWVKQFGSDKNEDGLAVAVDKNDTVFIAGYTEGNLGGAKNAGGQDMIVIRCDNAGNASAIRQYGSKKDDTARGVSVDKEGNVYIAGTTGGSFDETENQGETDMLLVKFDHDLNPVWTKGVGTSAKDEGRAVALSSGGDIHLIGSSEGKGEGFNNSGKTDAIVVKWKIDNPPALAWTKEKGYEADGLNPENGSIKANYDYRVRYLDPDNDAPLAGYPKVHIKKDNVDISGSPFTMKEVDPGDISFNDGKTYSFQKELPDGDFSYGFEAYNIYNNKAEGEPVGDKPGPITAKVGIKDWIKQYGTADFDRGYGVAIDAAGDIYAAGSRLLIKYDQWGYPMWQKEMEKAVRVFGVASDPAGDVYVTGYATGNLDKNKNSGGEDIFLMKFDASGTRLWTRLVGTPNDDWGTSLAVDIAGNVYITGKSACGFEGKENAGSSDIILVKFNSQGERLWIKQFGTREYDEGRSITVEEGGYVYITGMTMGAFEGMKNEGFYDIVLIKCDVNGNLQWIQQLGGKNNDVGNAVTTDKSGNIFLTGSTGSGLESGKNYGGDDLVVVKYDPSGKVEWIRQTGTKAFDEGNGITADAAGNIYIAGDSSGEYDKNPNAGDEDVLFIKYDGNGNKQWARELGTVKKDRALGAVADSSGNVYLCGETWGSFEGIKNAGNSDIFLMKWRAYIQ